MDAGRARCGKAAKDKVVLIQQEGTPGGLLASKPVLQVIGPRARYDDDATFGARRKRSDDPRIGPAEWQEGRVPPARSGTAWVAPASGAAKGPSRRSEGGVRAGGGAACSYAIALRSATAARTVAASLAEAGGDDVRPYAA